MKFDPIDSFQEIGSGLIGRILTFFAAGWLGTALGRIASAVDYWSQLGNPLQWIPDAFESTLEPLVFVLWPLWLPFAYGKISCLLMPFYYLLLFIAFYRFVQDDEPKIVWGLALVHATSLLPLSDDEDPVSWSILGIFWIGLIAFDWWALQKWNPELVERWAHFFRMGDGVEEPQAEANQSALRLGNIFKRIDTSQRKAADAPEDSGKNH